MYQGFSENESEKYSKMNGVREVNSMYLCPSHIKEDLFNYCRDVLMPYMTLKSANMKHSAYGLKHIVEKEIDRYISEEELVIALAALGRYPTKYSQTSRYYPISEKYFKRPPGGRGYYG